MTYLCTITGLITRKVPLEFNDKLVNKFVALFKVREIFEIVLRTAILENTVNHTTANHCTQTTTGCSLLLHK